jgi:hypothetical protein
VSQAYLILYAYHLMSKVNIVNKEEEEEEEEETRCLDIKGKKNTNEFLDFFFHTCFMLCYLPEGIFFQFDIGVKKKEVVHTRR